MVNPGTRIYEYRLSQKISQANLAQKAGLAQANLSNIEKGKRDLTVATLLRIAAALEIKPSLLIEQEDSRKHLELTRVNIEKLAECILHPDVKVGHELGEAANLFRQIIPDAKFRVSSKKTQLAWMKIRQKFSSQEIHGICQRIEDARQRAYAKKTN